MFNLTPQQWITVWVIVAILSSVCIIIWLVSVFKAGSYNPPENIDEELKFTPPGQPREKLTPDEDDTPLTEAQKNKAIMNDWLALHTTKE